MTINPHLYSHPGYDALADFAPITRLGVGPLVLAVQPALPVRSVAELVALAKAQPGRLSFGSPGIGTPPHMAGELFKRMAAIDLTHVPYRGGGQAVSDLIGGQISMSIEGMNVQLPFVRSGQIRALAVTGPRALASLARCADGRRVGSPGLRIPRLGRRRGAGGDAATDRRSAGTRDRRRARQRRSARVVRVLRSRAGRGNARSASLRRFAPSMRSGAVSSARPASRPTDDARQHREPRRRRQRRTRPTRRLLEAINASWTTQAIAAAVELRIPELLAAAPLASAALARPAGCDAASLRRLLAALASLDLVAHDDDGRFALTTSGALLRADLADSLAAWALFNGRHAASRLAAIDRQRAQRAQRAHELGRQRRLRPSRSRPGRADLFHRAMTDLTQPIAAAFAAAVDLARARRVVDVGGGYGRLIATVLVAYPGVHGVLFDLPHAIAAAAPQLERAGVAGRCELVCGSFFETVPAGADAYLLKSVLHDWDDERSADILGACRQAMVRLRMRGCS